VEDDQDDGPARVIGPGEPLPSRHNKPAKRRFPGLPALPPRPPLATLLSTPPPGPFRPGFWKSPLRGTWLTSVFGLVLLVGIPIVAITGFLSYVAYGPQFGQAFPRHVGFLHLPSFDWPTDPAWLYRVTQGTHVALGLILIPIVLAKVWSVIPRLFTFPPVRSPAQALERISLLMLVGGIFFELVTGVMNIQYDYIWKFDFYTAHYYGAWVFSVAFVVHVSLKLPTMWRSLRMRSFRNTLRTNLADTEPEHVLEARAGIVYDEAEPSLAAIDPDPATLSRRGLFAIVGGSSLLLTLVTIGSTVGDSVRWTAVLSPRGRVNGHGPTAFPINRTAYGAGITAAAVGPDWILTLSGGPTPMRLTRDQLLKLPQHTENLPIACVEGWSTKQHWTGVRLRDLAALAGMASPGTAVVRSLEKRGTFNKAVLARNQVLASNSLLALQVNGVDLPMDHGYPARVMVPALPGVHQTKWVSSIEFRR
jgi:DMSO/TMAO reductase YedYZ molybdopterin-dependent catalytic subunit